MRKQDCYWWEHDHEVLDYWDTTLEVAWQDKQLVQRVARIIDHNVYMVGTVPVAKLRQYLRDEIPIRKFYDEVVEEKIRLRFTRHGIDFEEWDQEEWEKSLPDDNLIFYAKDLHDYGDDDD